MKKRNRNRIHPLWLLLMAAALFALLVLLFVMVFFLPALSLARRHLRLLKNRKKVLIAAGTGNNGADGIAVGRLLMQEGFQVTFFLAGEKGRFSELMKLQVDIIESFGNGAITNANAHTWAKNKAKEDFGWTKRSFDNLQNGRRSYYLEEESGERLSDDFHTFGFMWTPEALIFTGDGEIYCKLDMTDALYADYKYIYNLMPQKLTLTSIFGVEGSPAKIQGDDSENWNKTNIFSADYVHVYQLNDGQSLLYADAPVQW